MGEAVIAEFHDWGKANGFKRKGTTLHRDQPDSIAVVNLQGSQYGGRHYVNVGLYLKAAGDAEQPLENTCHIRTRLTQLDPNGEALELALNYSSDIDDSARRAILRASLDQYAEPLFALGASIVKLKRSRAKLERCLVSRAALDVLDWKC